MDSPASQVTAGNLQRKLLCLDLQSWERQVERVQVVGEWWWQTWHRKQNTRALPRLTPVWVAVRSSLAALSTSVHVSAWPPFATAGSQS